MVGLPRGRHPQRHQAPVDTGAKTVDQLAADAGIVPDTVRGHLRKLERVGLVRVSTEPGAEPMWTQARELDPATRYRIVGRVERGRLRQPADAVAPEYPRRRWWWWPWRRPGAARR